MRHREEVERMNTERCERITRKPHKLSSSPIIVPEDRETLKQAIALIEEGQTWRRAYIDLRDSRDKVIQRNPQQLRQPPEVL